MNHFWEHTSLILQPQDNIHPLNQNPLKNPGSTGNDTTDKLYAFFSWPEGKAEQSFCPSKSPFIHGLSVNSTGSMRFQGLACGLINHIPLNAGIMLAFSIFQSVLGFFFQLRHVTINPRSSLFSDVHECEKREHKCDNQTTICRNEPGSYTCQCKKGYQTDQSLYKCQGKTVTLRPRTDYAREIWSQHFHSEKASDLRFPFTLRRWNLQT